MDEAGHPRGEAAGLSLQTYDLLARYASRGRHEFARKVNTQIGRFSQILAARRPESDASIEAAG